jgi:hypothetical protein
MNPALADRPLPVRVKVIGVLLIISGAWAAVDVAAALAQGTISLNLGVLLLPAGIGVLMRSNGWRGCAVFVLWLFLIFVPIAALLVLGGALSGGGTLTVTIGSTTRPAQGGDAWVLVVALSVFALVWCFVLWMALVLQAPKVRAFYTAA